MPGNSNRKGAIRKTAKKPTVGSGGRVKRGLEGKGPTPKAKDRPYHQAYRSTKKAEKAEKAGGSGGARPGGGGSARPRKRSTSDVEWIAGRNSVVEALREGVPMIGVYVADGAERDGRLREAFALAADKGVSLLEVSKNELDRLTHGAVHQGLAAKIPPYEYAHPDDLLDAAEANAEAPLIVALDQVTDPRNLGAIVRSAAGFGAHGVVIPERRAASMTASAWKTSAGAAARIPVAQTVNLVRQLKAYQEAGLMVVGLAADGDVTLPELVTPEGLGDGPLVVVVGAEGGGLSRLVAETCDQLVSIPMANQLESLNAGVAASVTLYAVSEARARR
ncbi:23S rRNA (guanosine(2251)-2'-O)-methyltransferase RlmB [Nocardioides sp. W7]|uniref:23S rRNA (guanosine(2251)-2'-O)-methyltransferase RlmB n=1 Tax=Nocardioides sp. W7 TaxID=2931390 RepID=UPI001FD3A8CD|nr:23S rRNA (guanosine(2251)-2'-O)-methyltransferase RlmB [Nocardioides sp. W7]